MSIVVKVLNEGDAPVLDHVAPGVFDGPIRPTSAVEFLADPRHHLAVALDDQVVIGFASALHYVHPDRTTPDMWINEIGVAPDYRGRGIAKAMLDALFRVAKQLGCREAWVLTERYNAAAMRLYMSKGGHLVPNDITMFFFRLDEVESTSD